MADARKPPKEASKDERLAAALRENLKRRKAQARAKQDDVKGKPANKDG